MQMCFSNPDTFFTCYWSARPSNQGPLLGVTNFHPSTIRWCLMHVVNLGILFTVNGSALTPACNYIIFIIQLVWQSLVTASQVILMVPHR